MRLLPLLILGLAPPALGQTVSEIPAPLEPTSWIDMDRLPVGPTDVAALNAAGTNGGATLADLQLIGKGGSASYNLQTCGFALAAAPGSGGTAPRIINGRGSASYDPFRVRVDLQDPSVEFGLMMGDWGGAAELSFFLAGQLVTTYTSSVQLQCTPQHYRMSGGQFDRVEIDVPGSGGNFVLLDLYVEKVGGSDPQLAVQSLVAGGSATVEVRAATPRGQVRVYVSRFGGGPISTVYGDLLVSRPFRTLPFLRADDFGVATSQVMVPAALAGRMLWIHAVDVASRRFTNALQQVVG